MIFADTFTGKFHILYVYHPAIQFKLPRIIIVSQSFRSIENQYIIVKIKDRGISTPLGPGRSATEKERPLRLRGLSLTTC